MAYRWPIATCARCWLSPQFNLFLYAVASASQLNVAASSRVPRRSIKARGSLRSTKDPLPLLYCVKRRINSKVISCIVPNFSKKDGEIVDCSFAPFFFRRFRACE